MKPVRWVKRNAELTFLKFAQSAGVRCGWTESKTRGGRSRQEKSRKRYLGKFAAIHSGPLRAKAT